MGSVHVTQAVKWTLEEWPSYSSGKTQDPTYHMTTNLSSYFGQWGKLTTFTLPKIWAKFLVNGEGKMNVNLWEMLSIFLSLLPTPSHPFPKCPLKLFYTPLTQPPYVLHGAASRSDNWWSQLCSRLGASYWYHPTVAVFWILRGSHTWTANGKSPHLLCSNVNTQRMTLLNIREDRRLKSQCITGSPV